MEIVKNCHNNVRRKLKVKKRKHLKETFNRIRYNIKIEEVTTSKF